MIPLSVVLILLVVHFVADFIVQTDNQARHKSTSNAALGAHICTYSACFIGFGVEFVLITAGLHFLTDYVSSRWAKMYYQRGDTHCFFIVVGGDQLLHAVSLILTWVLLHG